MQTTTDLNIAPAKRAIPIQMTLDEWERLLKCQREEMHCDDCDAEGCLGCGLSDGLDDDLRIKIETQLSPHLHSKGGAA